MIALISDVHGNYTALSSVIDEIDAIGVDHIICLGDTAGYYAEVNECCELLQEIGALCIQGNHDYYLVNDEQCPRSNSANECLDLQRKLVSPETLLWLASLPVRREVAGIDCLHGGWNDPLEEYVTPSAAYFGTLPGTLFASGHTHVPIVWSGANKTYCNPGSVGQPRDGDPRASFALFDGLRFTLHRVAYDVEKTQNSMRAHGLRAYLYENLTLGTRIGGKIDKYD